VLGEPQIGRAKRISAIPVALTLLLLFLAAFAGIFGYFLAQGVRQTSTALEERASAAAQVVATNASWINEVSNQTLRRVDAALGPTLRGQIDSLQVALGGLPPQVDVYVVDDEANVLFSTVPGAISIADRDYFVRVRDGARFAMSGATISRINGESIFVFSKRVERDGEFAGAVMVSFPASVIDTLWNTLDVEEASTISLVRSDGLLIARHPTPTGPVDLSDHPLFTQYLPSASSGIYVSPSSPLDGIARVVSYRAVEGTEIIALASISSDGAWQNFRRSITAVFFIVSPIILGLIVGSVWIIRLLFRDAARGRELEEAVENNTLLFREIHHRVKNNLQSVQSLVRMQDMPASAKLDLHSRLAAMAAMHEHIYQFDRYVDIDARDFVPVIVDEVIAAYGVAVTPHYELEPVMVDRDHATPLALLLSELITNALKYAFPDGRDGEIRIRLKAAGKGRAQLTVADNGVGLGETVPTTGMGVRLIKGVVSQMAGRYELRSDGGTIFKANIALATAGHEAVEDVADAADAGAFASRSGLG
jgi:two-component sensor histidine kinase